MVRVVLVCDSEQACNSLSEDTATSNASALPLLLNLITLGLCIYTCIYMHIYIGGFEHCQYTFWHVDNLIICALLLAYFKVITNLIKWVLGSHCDILQGPCISYSFCVSWAL